MQDFAYNATNFDEKSFFIIHHSIQAKLENLSGNANKLFNILRTYSNADYKPVFPKTSTLAARMKCCIDTVTNILKELENSGLIIIQRKWSGNRNRYHFTFDKNYSHNKNSDSAKNIRLASENKSETIQNAYPKNFRSNNNMNSQNSKIIKTTTNQKTNQDVDVNYLTNSLIEEHDKLINKLDFKINPIVDKRFQKQRLDTLYGKGLVDLVSGYLLWDRKTKRKINAPAAFLTWGLKNVHEIDFDDYFSYLQKRIKNESRAIKKKSEDYNQSNKQSKFQQYYEMQEKILQSYKRDNSAEYDRLKSVLEARQRKSLFGSKPGIVFDTIVRENLCKEICTIENIEIPLHGEIECREKII